MKLRLAALLRAVAGTLLRVTRRLDSTGAAERELALCAATWRAVVAALAPDPTREKAD